MLDVYLIFYRLGQSSLSEDNTPGLSKVLCCLLAVCISVGMGSISNSINHGIQSATIKQKCRLISELDQSLSDTLFQCCIINRYCCALSHSLHDL